MTYGPQERIKQNRSKQNQSQAETRQPVANQVPAFKDNRASAIEHSQQQSLMDASMRHQTQQSLIQKMEAAPKPNQTGLPDNVKSGVEALSGMSLDHVRVHYNSSQPAQLNAHAYAQGSDIHVAPGQEQHLAHEAWHIVQQAQGRVQPTAQMKGDTAINDDLSLEQEADVMGAKAVAQAASHAAGCACAGCCGGTGEALSQAPVSTTASAQLMCDNGHAHHAGGACPDKFWDRTAAKGVKLGEHHKAGSGRAGKRKTTKKVEARLTSQINAALNEDESSKARVTGMKGQNVMWEVDRATKAKQIARGPRHVLQHIGGGGAGDALDIFEDRDHGAMSDTDDEEVYSDDEVDDGEEAVAALAEPAPAPVLAAPVAAPVPAPIPAPAPFLMPALSPYIASPDIISPGISDQEAQHALGSLYDDVNS